MNGSGTVSQDELDSWTQEFMQPYPCVMGDGKNGTANKVFQPWGPSISLPFNLLVDRNTMAVLKHVAGSTSYASMVGACDSGG